LTLWKWRTGENHHPSAFTMAHYVAGYRHC
jgi:hypothetical protein